MENRKRPPAFPIAIITVIAYVLLFPNRATPELVVRVAWSRPLAGRVTALTGEAHAFRVGGQYGYVDAEGAILRLESVFHDVTLSDDVYVNYAKAAESLVVRRRDGSIAGTISSSSWPLVPGSTPDRVYLFSTDLLAIAENGLDGTERWRREIGSLITCFAAVPRGFARAVVGTLSGRLHVLGDDGLDIQVFETEGSRIAGTYGCAVSPDGELVAVVQGLDPQRLVLLAAEEGSYRVRWSRPLERESRAEITLRFTADSGYLVMDALPGSWVFDVKGRRRAGISLVGYLEEAVSAGPSVILSSRAPGGEGELALIVPPDIVASRASVPPSVSEIRHLSGHDTWFLYGAAGRISRMDVLRL